MYGLVNKAVEDLVVTRFGADTWEAIKRKADIEHEAFVGMQAYDDAVTYRLVGAASEVLAIPPASVLEAFGEHWILYTANEGYGHLLEMAGTSFVEFLENVDDMHARVSLSMPKLRPPRLSCVDVTETSVRLEYHSEREGLAPMVIGLLKGLGARFETPVDVEHTRARGPECDHDEFVVRYQSTL